VRATGNPTLCELVGASGPKHFSTEARPLAGPSLGAEWSNGLRLKAYAPAGLWGAFLLFLGGRSDVPAVDTDLPLDKAAHFFCTVFWASWRLGAG
jgi:hypothetical protein